MLKRILFVLMLVAVVGSFSAIFTNTAQAWRGRPYGGYYYGPRAAYYGPVVVPYRTYYAPRVVRPYYPTYYAYPYAYPVYPDYYYGSPSGVSVSVGF